MIVQNKYCLQQVPETQSWIALFQFDSEQNLVATKLIKSFSPGVPKNGQFFSSNIKTTWEPKIAFLSFTAEKKCIYKFNLSLSSLISWELYFSIVPCQFNSSRYTEK